MDCIRAKWFPLALILAGYVLLGIAYDTATPIFEASDEILHFPVVRHIALGSGLPVQRPGVPTDWRQEGSQPPLYYSLAAALTFWVDTGDFPERAVANPFARIGIPGTTHNVNFVRHTAAEAWPYRGAVLAVHLIRWFSVLLGACSVALTYRLAEALFPGVPGLPALAASLVAFNPMFLFISASVNNDNLLVLLATASLLLIARLAQAADHRLLIAIGALLGLAALTKISGLVLFPVVALALVARRVRRHLEWETRKGQLELWNLKFEIWNFAVVFGLAVIVSGWWYLRNYRLYGEWLGLRTMVQVAGGREATPDLASLAAEFPGFWLSYWGVFGAFNVLPGRWVFWAFGGLTLAALAGALLAARGTRLALCSSSSALHPPQGGFQPSSPSRGLSAFTPALAGGARVVHHSLMWLFVALTFVGVVRWTSLTLASQGRLMFGAIAPLACYLAAGLLALPGRRRRWQGRAGAALGAGLACMAAIIPFAYIRPAYRPPTPVMEAGLPENLSIVAARFGESIELIGYVVAAPRLHPGEYADVTLYWRALAQTDRDHNLFLHLLGRRATEIGKIDTWPGGGLLPTSQWLPGEIYPDRYLIPISGQAEAPTLLRLDVGYWDVAPEEGLPIYDAAGNHIPSATLHIGRLMPLSPQPVNYLYADGSTLEGGVTLLGYDLDAFAPASGPIALTLYWQSEATVAEDYTVFVHLDDPGGRTLAQADGPPLGGDWPTSAWAPGQPVVDRRVIVIDSPLPPGEYRLRVGLYDRASGVRLAAWDVEGREWADWAIVLSQPVVVR